MKLGEKIGEGGEGMVYTLTDEPGMLAKIAKDPDKLDEKYEALVSLRSDRLDDAAAWPLEKVHDEDGKTVGYKMRHYQDTVLLHQVFQTKSRVRELPRADWKFLIRVAKNLATCVHLVHSDGLVIGDLNESNVLVSGNALVRLIDCDSFQIELGGYRQTCDVGKGEYLAPELQGMSLEGCWRTADQDLFPLAVLVFQLLLLGRHPFAGRGGAEIPLEEAIRLKRYAYLERGEVQPPPGMSIAWLPTPMRQLFERAFTGAAQDRPTAKEWHQALDDLEGRLSVCVEHPRHLYWNLLAECPWCHLEDRWRILLFGSVHLVGTGPTASLEPLLTRLERDLSRPFRQLPQFSPDQLGWGPIWTFFLASLYLGQLLVGFANLDPARGLIILLAAMALPTAFYFRRRLRWGIKLIRFGDESRRLRARWKETADPSVALAEAELLKFQIEKVPSYAKMLAARRAEVLSERYSHEVRAHLKKYSIHSADASVLVTRLDAMRSAGITTAADLEEDHPFVALTAEEWSELMGWKAEIEKQFWSSTTAGLSDAEEAYIEQRVRREWEQYVREVTERTDTLTDTLQKVADQQMHLMDLYAQSLLQLKGLPGLERGYLAATGEPLPAPANDRNPSTP